MTEMLLLFTLLVSVAFLESECSIITVDRGKNVTLPCLGLSDNETLNNVMWVFQGNNNNNKHASDHLIDNKGGLVLSSVSSNDTGNYSCRVDNDNEYGNNSIINKVNLLVRTEPLPLVNVSVHLSTILGLIYWRVAGDGGSPIIDFTAQYRSAIPIENDTLEMWKPISPNHISPNCRQIDVYHLLPNSSYWFRVWATNRVGSSIPVEVLGHTLISNVTAELNRHVMIGVAAFDTRVWVAAVSIVMGTLCILTVGMCLLLYRECQVPNENDDDQDVMELVPNIILNPGFVDSQTRFNNNAGPGAVIVASKDKYSRANGSTEPRKERMDHEHL